MKQALYATLSITYLIVVSLFFLLSCTEEEETVEPVVETGLPVEVGFTKAEIEVIIPEMDSQEIVEYGIKYGEEMNLTECLSFETTPPTSAFRVSLTELYAGTTYFYQTYIKTLTNQIEGEIKTLTTLSPEIHKVTPAEFVFPGDTVLVEGVFFKDIAKAVISIEKYEPYLLKGSDIIKHTSDSIVFIMPYLQNERIGIEYRQKGGSSLYWVKYEGLIFPEPKITAVNPAIVYDTQTVITVDVKHLNPRDSANRIKIGDAFGNPAKIVDITTTQIKFTLSEFPYRDENCDVDIFVSNGSRLLFTHKDVLGYGIKYEVEDTEGNSLKAISANDTVVFKMASSYSVSSSDCNFMFGNATGDYIAEKIDGDNELFYVKVPEDLPKGIVQVRMEMNQACSAITDSNTKVTIE